MPSIIWLTLARACFRSPRWATTPRARRWRNISGKRKSIPRDWFASSGWTTPAKTRFLAGWPHTAQQQVLRVDREPEGLPAGTSDALVRKARERIAGVSAVLISDYGYGSATPEIVAGIRGRKGWTHPATLDSRYRLHDYAHLDLTAATPNEAEMEAAHNGDRGRRI